MKKLYTLLAVIILFFVVPCAAQIKKGSLFLGGDLGGYTQKSSTGSTTENRQNGITISPVFGKAIRENLVFGGELNFFFSEISENSSSAYVRQRSFGGGLFLRKYKTVGNSGFSVFIQGGLNVGQNKIEYKGSPVTVDQIKRVNVNLSARPGLSYAISRKLQLETGLNNLVNLNYFNEKRTSSVPGSAIYRTTGASVGTSLFSPSGINVGFRLLINNKAG